MTPANVALIVGLVLGANAAVFVAGFVVYWTRKRTP